MTLRQEGVRLMAKRHPGGGARDLSVRGKTLRVGTSLRSVLLLPQFGIDDDRYGTVVSQSDKHLSAEFSDLDRLSELLLKLLNESFVQGNGDFRTGGAAVRRAVAFSSAGKKCELADEKDLALNIPAQSDS